MTREEYSEKMEALLSKQHEAKKAYKAKVHERKMEHLRAIAAANKVISEIKEQWADEKNKLMDAYKAEQATIESMKMQSRTEYLREHPDEDLRKKPVSILRDADGNAVGVLVQTWDESFALDLHHLDNGKEYKWDEAMERLKELGKDGFNEKQGKIIAVYHEEIDAALEEAGGDKLGWEWAVGEYNGNHAWLYNPTFGALDYIIKFYSSQVRPLLASKQIEELLHRAV